MTPASKYIESVYGEFCSYRISSWDLAFTFGMVGFFLSLPFSFSASSSVLFIIMPMICGTLIFGSPAAFIVWRARRYNHELFDQIQAALAQPAPAGQRVTLGLQVPIPVGSYSVKALSSPPIGFVEADDVELLMNRFEVSLHALNVEGMRFCSLDPRMDQKIPHPFMKGKINEAIPVLKRNLFEGEVDLPNPMLVYKTCGLVQRLEGRFQCVWLHYQYRQGFLSIWLVAACAEANGWDGDLNIHDLNRWPRLQALMDIVSSVWTEYVLSRETNEVGRYIPEPSPRTWAELDEHLSKLGKDLSGLEEV